MKSEIWDLDKGRKIAEADDIAEFSINGNYQLYILAKTTSGSTEYILLQPGWRIVVSGHEQI